MGLCQAYRLPPGVRVDFAVTALTPLLLQTSTMGWLPRRKLGP